MSIRTEVMKLAESIIRDKIIERQHIEEALESSGDQLQAKEVKLKTRRLERALKEIQDHGFY